MTDYSTDYLLNKKVRILQPIDGYRASTDAVFLAAFVTQPETGGKILDVGSGTGAVSLCLAHHFQNQPIIGAELQPRLADLSQKSAALNGFDNLSYIQADIRQKNCGLSPCTFSAVVTNPPYYQNTFLSPNQSKALAHAHQDFDLTSWLKFCLKMLKPFGKFYMINRPEALNETLAALGYQAGGIEILPIFSKNKQPAKRILISAQKDSKAPLQILPPFYIHQQDGSHTEQAQKILREGFLFEH